MSRSYTAKGSYARQSNGARPKQFGENPNSSPDGVERAEDATKPTETEKYQRREAYTVVVPNRDKREKLLQVQQREEEISRQQKEKKGRFSIKMAPQKVGGENMAPGIVRTQQQQRTNMSPTLKALEMRKKREKWNQEKRDKEEEEIKKKKAAARLQAEKNEKRASLQKETVRRYWDNLYNSEEQDSQSSRDTQRNLYPEFPTAANGIDDDSLAELCEMYPECSPSSLMEVLLSEGSIEGVRKLLG